ncbi:hypothetical protein HFO39_22635 [Rhizobium leguminosarum]|uniref:hypothetical protein n=1 Tax=Rhizobium leguminosarum TaxID=384 RepID=UPI001C93B664|nr:hypothetical protein [Rhizobium leguminosarum]MBY5637531.1 hypothetical protein [Rhizobium leguminosarum]
MKRAVLSFALAMLAWQVQAATCPDFHASTMDANGVPPATWRQDYPSVYPDPDDRQPWEAFNFRTAPVEYMNAVLETAKTAFQIKDQKLTASGQGDWWISQWLDYSNAGREPLMGLTKERGPDPGDLSETSPDGYQVWAVGFYNRPGAAVLGDIFAQPCNPSLPVAVKFPADTASIKFLFTDASTDNVTYLKDGPEYDAYIDPPGSGSSSHAASERKLSQVRLLQVDIAIKDARSRETGWVFGTFVWRAPPKGDKLFDNLVPVSLQWGNDPGVYDASIRQSWINPDLRGVTYGWRSRPTLGFMGRANGPADNIRSSCLSCHAAGRTPRALIGLLDNRFDMTKLYDPALVKSHVDTWFQNVRGGQLFQPSDPAVSSLDYSLQLETGMFRICLACAAGDLQGQTPDVCRASGFYNRPVCSASTTDTVRKQVLQSVPPPRQ